MKILKSLLFAGTFFLIVLIAGSVSSVYFSPVKAWPLAFLGLLFPYLVLLFVLLTLFWLFVKPRMALFPFITLLLSLPFITDVIQVGTSQTSTSSEKPIKLMSFNVRLFDLYNWSQNKKTREEIIAYILKENPDIIAFQEYYSNNSGYHMHTDSLRKWLKLNNHHTHFTQTLQSKQNWGIATFTRFPIKGKGTIKLNNSRHNTCIYTDILLPEEKTIRVFNMHLQSIHLKKEDYVFIDNLTTDNMEDLDLQESESILRKLKKAFTKRALQAETIRKQIDQSPYPVVVCGDFNDTPVSYAYHCLSHGLTDAFCESGSGLGRTYSGILPTMRIDYILHSGEIKSTQFKADKNNLSDHYPIMCNLSIKKTD